MMEQTIRQQIVNLLSLREMTAREISQAVGIREKEVYAHLEHIRRSLSGKEKRLHILPGRCLACEYLFKDRQRFSPPSHCPRCKESHIQSPAYLITARQS